ncbi:malto-oligosyltrehalose trehalohydrolase [Dyadobacter beijingensis]|uniref:Malto-oligosyltrehalose trehalohydrolase n=1 Tax=Dyadobacter beijingensis TaxID=365489 RepID=A0ABQ2HQM7_9BACT|nr:malto-oligosyltrehalose trehalohydrolase [Dyadobacter beijingensis]GGM88799.1 malto-oligosyltrehalose trehalohydrolase [Dyadobacter beijingensis]
MSYADLLKLRPGVTFNAEGEAQVLVWAPKAETVQLVFGKSQQPLALEKHPYGFWVLHTRALWPGDRYGFLLDGEGPYADPATLHQPDGVHGLSEAFDLQRFTWTDKAWQNPHLKDYIIYELHAGTFTSEGSFAAIETKLDYLLQLGVNAIEIMPLSQFAGDRNWGYDGVFPYSVQHSYGGPGALQRLVNACHEKGIAVVLDLVYNHLGPEGNILGAFGHYFTDKYNTPWGDAINFDDAWSDAVRHYFVQNALMWFRDFHIDGLRLDAVHAIKDLSPRHILQEIRQEVDALSRETGRAHYLIVEMDLNDTRYVKPADAGGYGMDAQWIDEFHHALRVSSGQERSGYYSDFDGVASLAKSFRDAYVFDGLYSEHRKRTFGMKADGIPGHQFIVFSQNHDHIGNRMLGERTSRLVSFEMQKLLAGVVFVSPFVPLLFMGEEWAEPNPFQYFVSHTDAELAEAVRKGRKREFAAFHLDGEAPDPVAVDTFENSKPQWHLVTQEPHRTMLSYYRKWIALRKSQQVLHECDRNGLSAEAFEEKEMIVIQRVWGGQHLVAFLNFSKTVQDAALPFGHLTWRKLIASSDVAWNGPQDMPEQADAGTLTVPAESITVYVNAISS